MIAALIAAAYTFTAVATGVEKGTTLEFLFVGADSDRDYEAMFRLEKPIATLCDELEKAGLERGTSVNLATCDMWPVGKRVTLKPDPFEYVERSTNLVFGPVIYTGGTRSEKGVPVANDDMPQALWTFYALAQSPFVYDSVIEQGVAYNSHVASKTLAKGTRIPFTMTWDDASLPKRMSVMFRPGNAGKVLTDIKTNATSGALVVTAAFDPAMTLREAQTVAQVLSAIDSPRVKFNGRPAGQFFYQAYQPLEKWRDRKNRMQQPFEVTIKTLIAISVSGGSTNSMSEVVYIDEDWSGEGMDPKLTPRKISFADMAKYPSTDTCFIFASQDERLERLYAIVPQLPKTVRNIYVYGD